MGLAFLLIPPPLDGTNLQFSHYLSIQLAVCLDAACSFSCSFSPIVSMVVVNRISMVFSLIGCGFPSDRLDGLLAEDVRDLV
jgi:hypothetical protein